MGEQDTVPTQQEHATANNADAYSVDKPPKKPLSLYNHFAKLERAAIAAIMPESATTCEVCTDRPWATRPFHPSC
jgi:hypothetical protein